MYVCTTWNLLWLVWIYNGVISAKKPFSNTYLTPCLLLSYWLYSTLFSLYFKLVSNYFEMKKKKSYVFKKSGESGTAYSSWKFSGIAFLI